MTGGNIFGTNLMQAQRFTELKIMEDLVEYLQGHGIMAHIRQFRDLVYVSTELTVMIIQGGKIKFAGQKLAEDLVSIFPPDMKSLSMLTRDSEFISLADPEYREKIFKRINLEATWILDEQY